MKNKMKIAFFTEMGFVGKTPRNHENMRTEFAWFVALDAFHYPIGYNVQERYDLGIVIIPKKNPNFNINQLKNCCKKIAVMQEGPSTYFQDYPLEQQIWYFNTLISADIIYTHNKIDKQYYEGLTNHPDVRVMSSLMIEDAIGELPKVERNGVIIGGNFCSWYGGFDSYIVAKEIEEKVWAPSMGRKIPNEEVLLKHLPYMNWKQWIHKLNEFKYAIHLMRTQAAGTFALNCSYLGIPCVGYSGLDTQESLHSFTTVDVGDLKNAKECIRALKYDENFYIQCSEYTKKMYVAYYNEETFKQNFYKQFELCK